MLKTRIKKLEEQTNFRAAVHLKVTDHQLLVNDGKEQPYVPSKTGESFHASNDLVRLIIGPYGSGKSTTCCAEIVLRSVNMPPCYDGVRRSRWAIVRNTYGDLESTTLKTWLEWFWGLGHIHRRLAPRLNYTHTFNDGNGLVELELMFIALDRPDDIRKLKSLEVTGVYLNELSEVPQAALEHFKTRLRYPAPRDCDQPYWKGVLCDTNPPDVDHWVYELFEVTTPVKHSIFHQPPAVFRTKTGYEVNPDADNLQHVSGKEEYYMNMIAGQTEEFIKVYAMGQYGTVVIGKFVYNNYNDDLHSDASIDIDENEPLLVAWDYGTVSPACLICQVVESRLHCIKEFVCEYMSPKELYQISVQPYLVEHCQGMMIQAVGDPADTYDGREQLLECGLDVMPATTNKIEARIRSVRDLLNQLVKGAPKLIVSREGCPKLRQGFLGKYNYKRLKVVGEERYQDFPNKTHPFSDIHDCLQYASMFFTDLDYTQQKEWLPMPEDLLEDDGRSNVTGY